jgi:hypothetical protein
MDGDDDDDADADDDANSWPDLRSRGGARLGRPVRLLPASSRQLHPGVALRVHVHDSLLPELLHGVGPQHVPRG